MLNLRRIIPFSIIKRSRLEALQRDNRRIRQQLRIERENSESTKTIIEKETYNVFSHIARIIDGETGLIEHTRDLLNTYAQYVLNKKKARIYVYEGDFTKNTFSIDTLLQRPLKRTILFKQYASEEEAYIETLVTFPKDGPKRPFGICLGRYFVEEEIIGYNLFELLHNLSQHEKDCAQEIKSGLIDKLLQDQAFFQAHPPVVPKALKIAPDTAKKLIQSFATFAPVDDLRMDILEKIGDYLDRLACVPYRDAWLFNTRLAVQEVGMALELGQSGEGLDSFIRNILARARETTPAEIARILVDSIYQMDFGRIRYDATEKRDRIHILYSAASKLTPLERVEKERAFQRMYKECGGTPPVEEDLALAILNNSMRSAYAFQTKKPHPLWASFMQEHLRIAKDALQAYQGDLLTQEEHDRLVKGMTRMPSMMETSG